MKEKLTYRNEITITLGDSPRTYFRMMCLLDDQQICDYCARVFMNEVKCPKNTAFGGKITKDENQRIECSIYEQINGYAGKVIFINPSFS